MGDADDRSVFADRWVRLIVRVASLVSQCFARRTHLVSFPNRCKRLQCLDLGGAFSPLEWDETRFQHNYVDYGDDGRVRWRCMR